jgi:translocation and assembly module TamA
LCWFGASAGAQSNQDYEITIEGAPRDLTEKLETLSSLKEGSRTYPTLAALRRAARRDQNAFNEALKAAGYYGGAAKFTIAGAEGEPAQVAFTIETGPQFSIVEYEILYADEGSDRPASLAEADIEANGAAAGSELRSVQQRFLHHLWESGYPQATITARRAIANFENATAHAIMVFTSGPKARFGDLRIDGLDKTKAGYIEKLTTWDRGQDYERSKIISFRDRLADTGLFSTIDITPGAPDEEGVAPTLLTVEERKHRTIGVGASFSTSEGPGGRIFFENRNMFGAAENLRIELSGTGVEQKIAFDAAKPLPGLPGRIFANMTFANETTDAFDARSLRLSSGAAKLWLDDRLETRGAVALETSNVKSDGDEERVYFVSVPLSVLWNTENDPLNPTKGVRTGMTVTPYTGTDSFTQAEAFARSRLTFGADHRYLLAGRVKFGATFGQTFDSLPLNKRFFAGGGASVRGYGFQEAGPLDAEGDPIGGLSLIEGAVEARGMITDNIQIAAFIDAAAVSETRSPNFDEKFFVGYGGGLRYFTPIGPIRVDAAFPVDPRETDRKFQIYIAIGQAF